MGHTAPVFRQKPLVNTIKDADQLNSNILVAYCGIPHVSRDINSQWVKTFVNGRTRNAFATIAGLTNAFSEALAAGDFQQTADIMIEETRIRLEMTPDVLDNTGKKLFDAAKAHGCGARFTGAGGGGCLWAIGPRDQIKALIPGWQQILDSIETAMILDTKIENKGVLIN
jgi:D-glycero-alpha-D-manno-heptose-7-phosphate kinase